MYDGNNYVMTQTNTTWWVVFLTIAVTITLAEDVKQSETRLVTRSV